MVPKVVDVHRTVTVDTVIQPRWVFQVPDGVVGPMVCSNGTIHIMERKNMGFSLWSHSLSSPPQKPAEFCFWTDQRPFSFIAGPKDLFYAVSVDEITAHQWNQGSHNFSYNVSRVASCVDDFFFASAVVCPVSGTLYVLAQSQNAADFPRIFVYSSSSGDRSFEVPEEKAVSHRPIALDARRGRLLLHSRDNQSIYSVDVEHKEATQKISTGNAPGVFTHAMTVDHHADLLYVLCGTVVRVFSLTKGRFVADYRLPQSPTDFLCCSSDSLYFSCCLCQDHGSHDVFCLGASTLPS